MSGGNPSKKQSRRKQQGWEEAGGEFYQESYPGGGEQDMLDNLQKTDASKIATLLPSKQVRAGTVKRVRSQAERRQSTTARSTTNRDVHISMLPDLSENLSNEERTWEEIMQIKAMPIPMAQKIELKAQLQSATKLRLQGLEQLHWKRRMAWQGMKSRLNSAAHKLQLWRSSFRTIEGNFGTGVMAYFFFLKWLFFLNLAISSMIVLFVIVPTIVLREPPSDTCEATSLHNTTECCSAAYLNKTTEEMNMILSFIQGTGWMEKSLVFYGLYSDKIYTFLAEGTTLYYDMPMAYLAVTIACMLFSLCAIVRSASGGFKDRLIEGEGQFYQYCNLVFGGWDFCIHNAKSALVKHRALYNEIKGCLEYEKIQEEKQSRSREEQIMLVFRRILVNVIVVSILVMSGSIIYFAFNFSVTELDRIAEEASGFITKVHTDVVMSDEGVNYESSIPYPVNMTPVVTSADISSLITEDHNNILSYSTTMQPIEPIHNTSFALGFTLFRTGSESFGTMNELRILLLEFLPSLCIVGLNLIVPAIFSNLIDFESYTPSFVINMTLFRTVFLRLSSLGVLISQMYMFLLAQESSYTCSEDTETAPLCWETYVGQQFYKLFISDFALQIVITFFVNFPRAMIARHVENSCMKFVCEQKFSLPKHVLDVVYSQTLCWMGAFYCPILPLLATVFSFFIFYIKKFSCLVNSTPSAIVYRASRSKSFFMFVLLLSFFVAVIPLSYAIAELHPSRSCGPFRSLHTVWEIIVITFQKFPSMLQTIIFLFGTSVFAIPIFIILILLVYYYWAVADANRHMVGVLKSQLVLEGHDKQFLLNRLSAFIRQQQKRNERLRYQAQASFADEDTLSSSTK